MTSFTGAGFETTGLARSVGAVHLFLAGVTNVASGALLVGLSVSGRLLPAAIDAAGRYTSPATALRYGGFLAVATDGALAVGAVLFCLGAFACVVSWTGLRRRRYWRRGFGLAVCNGANPLAFPLSFVAVSLLVVTRTEFTAGGDAGAVDGADYGS